MPNPATGYAEECESKLSKEAKQVIVVRKDLKMSPGKLGAQVAHAACSFMARRLAGLDGNNIRLTDPQRSWLQKSFTKIVLKVHSEDELLEINEKAKQAGLESHLITDSGRTEFKGIKTHTCIAIGPDWPDKIDSVTGHLKAYQ